MSTTFYALLVFAAGACYGILSTFVKLAYGAGFVLSDVTGSQFFYGTLSLWLAVLLLERKQVTKKGALKLLALGIPEAGVSLCYYHSLQTLPASLAVVFLFQSIWMGTAAECLLTSRRPSRQRILSILVTLIGTALAAGLVENGSGFHVSLGMFWGLMAALCYTIVMVALNRVDSSIPPLVKSAYLCTGGLVFVFLLLPPLFLTDAARFTRLLPFGLILGIFGVVLPPFLLSKGMPHISPGLGSLLAASELPVALLMSHFVLGETISTIQTLGIVFILGGILIGNRK